VQACCTQPAAAAAWPSVPPACSYHCTQHHQHSGAASPAAAGVGNHPIFATAASPVAPQHNWAQAHPPGRLRGAVQSLDAAACETGAEACAAAPPAPVDLRQQQHSHEWSPTKQHLQYMQSPAKVCLDQQGWTPSRPAAMMQQGPPQPLSPLPAAATSMQPLSGLVGQLQAGVARLQQQLGASQQQLTQRVQSAPDMQPLSHSSRYAHRYVC
jgi:hypothetical protein